MAEGHTKDTFRRRDDRHQDVRAMNAQSFCEICQEAGSHSTKSCSFNLRNKQTKWCAICETSEHDTSACSLNMRSKRNFQVYQAQSTDQQPQRNFQQDNYNNSRRGGYRRGGSSNQGGRNWNQQPQRKPRCYICLKDDHLFHDCPWKNKNDLKFCGNCGVGDHSLEDCPVILEKIRNKKKVQSSYCV